MTGTPFLAACALGACFFPNPLPGGPQPAANAAKSKDDKAAAVKPGAALPENAVAVLGSAKFRQSSTVYQVVCSPDGKLVASQGEDGTAWLWDAKSGNLIRRLAFDQINVGGLTFAPDSQFVAWRSGVSKDGVLPPQISVWSMIDQKSRAIPLVYDDTPFVVAPGGNMIALHHGTQIRLIDLTKSPSTIKGEVWDFTYPAKGNSDKLPSPLIAMHFSTDGKHLTAALADGTVQKWPVQAGPMFQLQGKIEQVDRPANEVWIHCPANDYVAVVIGQDQVQIRDRLSAKPLQKLPKLEGFVYKIAFSPDGKLMAISASVAKDQKCLSIWEIPSGKLKCKTATGMVAIPSLCFSADGKIVLTGCTDGTIRCWDVETGKAIQEPSAGHQDQVRNVAYSMDSKYVFSSSTDKVICKWEVKTGKLLSTIPTKTESVCLACAPNNSILAIAGSDNVIRLWHTENETELHKLEGHNRLIRDLAFSSDGKKLVSWATDLALRAWDPTTGKLLWELPPPADGAFFHDVKGLAFSPNGKYLFVGLADGNVAVRDASDGKYLRMICATGSSGSRILALAVSPDSNTLSVSHQSGLTATYEIATGQLRSSLHGLPALPVALPNPGVGCCLPFSSFSGIGSNNFSGMPFNPLLFPAADGPKHTGPIAALLFSPKGKYLVSGGQDGMVLLWGGLPMKALVKVGDHQGPITAIAFAPDGKTFATASADTTVIVWEMSRLLAKKVDPLDKNWENLASPLAPTALQAMQELADRPEKTLALLQKKMKPVALPSAQIKQWLTDLGSDHYPTRAKASNELEKIAEDIEPTLLDVLTKPPFVEVHLRVQLLLAKVSKDFASATRLQQTRALELLEQIDTPEARYYLQTLAQGTPEAWLTREAQKVLKRLEE